MQANKNNIIVIHSLFLPNILKFRISETRKEIILIHDASCTSTQHKAVKGREIFAKV